jgi:ribosomal protein L14E/L6E/L27E
MAIQWMKTGTKAALASAAFFSLSGCLILPGEFNSAMTVRQNGDFSFTYKGQIQLVGLANLLNSDFLGEGGDAEFKAVCWNDSIEPAAENNDLKVEVERDDVASSANGAFSVVPTRAWRIYSLSVQDDQSAVDDAAKAAEEAAQAAADAAAAVETWDSEQRECTPAEVEQQKADWDRQQAEKKKRDEQGKKMAEMMLGGIDPENPETIKRFTREVERLAAWHKVEHLGNGVFMVDYSTSGRLADDYAFPVIPRYALGEPMMHVTRWDNGRLRVEAPAFRSDPEMSFGALMGMGSMASGMLGKSSDKMPAEPIAIKGSFTLTTDARILANNSEEGPEESSGMQVLRWDIGPAAYGAPMALLKLAN